LSVHDAQAANIGVALDFDHPILAAPEIVVPEMLYSPPLSDLIRVHSGRDRSGRGED